VEPVGRGAALPQRALPAARRLRGAPLGDQGMGFVALDAHARAARDGGVYLSVYLSICLSVYLSIYPCYYLYLST